MKITDILDYYKALRTYIVYNLKPGIKVGKGTLIDKGALLKSRWGGKISIGSSCYVAKGAQLLTHSGNIIIGNNTTINPMTLLYGEGGLIIGNGVRIAGHCTIVPANHIFADKDIPIYKQGSSRKGIIIEDDVWIGSGARILDGTKISKGCVIGANAVVTKSTEPYGIYVGAPAKRIKERC